jgi:hypothetical protein
MTIDLSKDERLMILYFIKKIFEKIKSPDGGIDYIEKVAWEFELEHSLTESLNESIQCLILNDSDEEIKSLLSDFIKDIINEESFENNEVWEYIDYIGIKIEKSILNKKESIDFDCLFNEDLDSIFSQFDYEKRERERKYEEQVKEKTNHLPTIPKQEETSPIENEQKEIQTSKIKESENIDYIVISPENRSVNNEILFKDI